MENYRQVVLLLPLLALLLSACALSPIATEAPEVPIELESLLEEITDPRLLRQLGVERLTILEAETYRAEIGTPSDQETLGTMYFTIQDGWHLKADHEVMQFVPGQGWLIAEQ